MCANLGATVCAACFCAEEDTGDLEINRVPPCDAKGKE